MIRTKKRDLNDKEREFEKNCRCIVPGRRKLYTPNKNLHAKEV